MTTLSFLTPLDWLVFGALFALSVPYAFLLQLWWRKYPQSYEALTWFQVVIGVGYTLLGLVFILPWEYWLRACAAFFFASLAIIFRSVAIHAENQRQAESISDERGNDVAERDEGSGAQTQADTTVAASRQPSPPNGHTRGAGDIEGDQR